MIPLLLTPARHRVFNYFRSSINLLLALLLAFSGLSLSPLTQTVSAGTITVTSTADSGPGTLRQAIANAVSGDTITFSLTTPATITLTSEISVSKDLIITGPGTASLTISGGNTNRIFNVTAGTLRINQMTIANGYIKGSDGSVATGGTVSALGGAIFIAANAGVVAMNVNFQNNRAVGGNGGPSSVDVPLYGGGGGGAGGNEALAGNYGGGGGGGNSAVGGGNAGFGGGGGGGGSYTPGGSGSNGGGGGGYIQGGAVGYGGGGGGAALGGAIFIQAGGALALKDVTLSSNSVQGGNGGSSQTNFFGGGGGGGGAGLGSAVFSAGSLCILSGVVFSSNTASGGVKGNAIPFPYNPTVIEAYNGDGTDTTPGYYEYSATGDNSCAIIYYKPSDLAFTPVSMEENLPVGSSAGSFSTTDLDAGDTFTYSLVSGTGSTDNALFSISGSNLLTAAVLNYETKSTYSIRVRTTDSHNLYHEETFSISVSNVNDAPTGVSLSPSSFAENITVGTTIGTLTAIDQESASQTFTYALVNPGGSCNGTDNASFSLSGNQLKSATTYNHETKSSFTICVRATDNGSPAKSYDQQLTLSTTNVNETPTGITLSNATVDENEGLGTVVGTFSTADPDGAGTYTYALASGVTGCVSTDNASFAISGSNLTTNTTLNHEVKDSYVICVRSTDSGSLSVTQSFSISIMDLNEAPSGLGLSNTLVDENLSTNTTVGVLTSTDEDAGQTFSYTLAADVVGCDGAGNSSFLIAGDALKTNASFNHEIQSGYSVCIRTTDSGSPALDFTQAFTIEIGDENEIPTDISLSSDTIAENSPVNSTVGTLSTSDPDSGQTFTYSLDDSGTGCSSADNAAFTVTGSSLKTAAALNHETQSSYSICLRATDSGSPALSYTELFTISITDVNETPNLINLSANTIDENLSAGATVGVFSTDDPDDSQSFTYVLDSGVSGCDGTDNASFTVAGSTISSNNALNYEGKTAYSICVRSTDNGSPALSLTQHFTIQVNNVNETPTDIHLTNTSIEEHLPIDSLVGSLTTSDPDTGQSYTYSLVSGVSGCSSADNDSFAVDGANLRTAGVLNFESQSSFSICLRATDNGSPSLNYTKAFTISVTDINEAPTDLSLSNDVIAENQASGTLVGIFSSTDLDNGQTFSYAFTSTGLSCSGTDNSLFTISGDSLLTNASFDYEMKHSYDLCVSSTDNGSPVQNRVESFTVQVSDVNEAPTGIDLSITSLAENTPPGSSVGTLTTSDQDQGQSYVYTLVSEVAGCDGSDNSAFSISGDQLKTVSDLNFETQSSYSICVRTTDNGSPALEYTQSILLDITDLNESPYLDQPLADQSVNAGSLFQQTVPSTTFIDPDGDSLTYTAKLASGDPLPAWLTFTSSTRTFSGTPIQAQTLSITVTASDGHGEKAEDTFALEIVKVYLNNNPVVSQPIPNASATAGVAFSFTFAADTFVDRDLDALTYQAALENEQPLPSWLSFNAGSRTFSGTPAPADEGLLVLKVYAFDGKGGQASTTFQVGVNKNVSPAVNNPIPDQSAARGEAWVFQFAANTFSDPENDPLTYTASLSDGSSMPVWLFFDPATRTFSGTPPVSEDEVNLYSIRVTAADGNPGNTTSDTFSFSLWSYTDEENVLPVGSQVVIAAVPNSGPTAPPQGTEPLEQTIDFQILYDSEPVVELEGEGIQVCFEIGSEETELVGGDLSRLVIGTSHDGGPWQLLETTIESNPLRICAYANQFSLFDVFLKPSMDSDELDDVKELPETGFTPGQVTLLPEQPSELAYASLGDVWLEIPALNLKTSIVGVPLVDGAWDVGWLWNNAGWLHGSAFPGLDGNSVLTGHVVNSSGLNGPFAKLKTLAWGDRIIVHVYDDSYIYEVRTVEPNVVKDDVDALDHAEQPTLTLITCRLYDPIGRTYLYRTVVQAVLVKVESE